MVSIEKFDKKIIERMILLPNNSTVTINAISEREETLDKMENIGCVYDVSLKKNITIWRILGKNGLFFISKMAINADGAYKAYHPLDIGLDNLRNAGEPGNWYGVVTDNGRTDGEPIQQKSTDPAPKYFISQTALFDANRERTDPRAYVDSETIPFFVLPKHIQFGAKLGDIGVVINKENAQVVPAIFADLGPTNKIGEGSIALAKSIGINSSPRDGGVEDTEQFVYIVFPSSGEGGGNLRSIEEINSTGRKLFEEWGGINQVNTVISRFDFIESRECGL